MKRFHCKGFLLLLLSCFAHCCVYTSPALSHSVSLQLYATIYYLIWSAEIGGHIIINSWAILRTFRIQFCPLSMQRKCNCYIHLNAWNSTPTNHTLHHSLSLNPPITNFIFLLNFIQICPRPTTLSLSCEYAWEFCQVVTLNFMKCPRRIHLQNINLFHRIIIPNRHNYFAIASEINSFNRHHCTC